MSLEHYFKKNTTDDPKYTFNMKIPHKSAIQINIQTLEILHFFNGVSIKKIPKVLFLQTCQN